MVRIRTDESVTEEDGREVWRVYRLVFGDVHDYLTWLERTWSKHRAREGFRLARAYDEQGLVGFAYGYVGRSGQWWTDNARDVLGPVVADAWLSGHFEVVVSIGVLEASRGAGIGRSLLRALTEGLPRSRLLLMTTSDPSDPARRLYAAEGWEVIGPGLGEGTVIMGKQKLA